MKVILDYDCLPLRMMKDLLTDDQAKDVMWRIGNAIRDPSSKPSIVILWGRRGGDGKGHLIDMISRLIPGVKANLPGEALSYGSKAIDNQQIREMASLRFAFMD